MNAALRILAAAALAAAATGCAGEAPATPDADALLREEHFYEGTHLGATVTLEGEVAEVLGPRLFELSAGDAGDAGGRTLQVVTPSPTAVAPGETVRVTGVVGQHHLAPSAARLPYLQADLYEKYETEVYLYDAVVER